MSLRLVVASKPSTRFAFSVDGHALLHVVLERDRRTRSGTARRRRGSSSRSARPARAPWSTRLVERLKSSLSASGCSIAIGDPAGEVAAVGVVPNLRAVAEDVQRVLALEHLLHDVGNDVAHRELHVAAQHLHIAERPALPHADAVERPHDRVRQARTGRTRRARSTRPRASGSRTTTAAAGISRSWPSYDGHSVADSNTIDELM